MKALIVDDSRVVRIVVGRMLKELGYATSEAEDGKSALDKLCSEGPFDLAMVDWNMPVMDGLEFLLAIKAGAAPSPRHIVMVTTETDPAQIARALDAGATEYVMKPFTRDAIASKLAMLDVGGAV